MGATTPPSAPSNLNLVINPDLSMTFNWDSSYDNETPSSGLTYNLRIGVTPGGNEILSAHALGSGLRTIPAMGNIGHQISWDPPTLPVLGTYYWSVQAIDAGFAGSAFATEEWFAQGVPQLLSLEDVTGDQGRNIRVTWNASVADVLEIEQRVTGYSLFRRQDSNKASSKASNDRVQPLETEMRMSGWDFLTWVPAFGEETYQFVAPTLCDSTAANGICWSVFKVRAGTNDPFYFADSPADSGYSVDNLAPSVPGGFQFAGDNLLAWQASSDVDFNYFTVYGSANNVFGGDATLINDTTGVQMDVTGQTYPYYFLTATDFAGNESSSAQVGGTSGVTVIVPTRFALHASAPNPFNPRTSIKFDLPEASPVNLRVYDLSGRLVRILVGNEHLAVGRHEAIWDGRNGRGLMMAAGVYVYRLETSAFSASRRMTLLK